MISYRGSDQLRQRIHCHDCLVCLSLVLRVFVLEMTGGITYCLTCAWWCVRSWRRWRKYESYRGDKSLRVTVHRASVLPLSSNHDLYLLFFKNLIGLSFDLIFMAKFFMWTCFLLMSSVLLFFFFFWVSLVPVSIRYNIHNSNGDHRALCAWLSSYTLTLAIFRLLF